jgi:hypothetical protein
MFNNWNPSDRFKRPDLLARHAHYERRIHALSDQGLADHYTTEMGKLKTLNRFGRLSEKFKGYPNTLKMNLCQSELKRRGLPVPQVHLPE